MKKKLFSMPLLSQELISFDHKIVGSKLEMWAEYENVDGAISPLRAEVQYSKWLAYRFLGEGCCDPEVIAQTDSMTEWRESSFKDEIVRRLSVIGSHIPSEEIRHFSIYFEGFGAFEVIAATCELRAPTTD
jgi:hypothetical protein